MGKHIDFIFDEYNTRRRIFRFYPERSHVHGFGEKCPQSWDEVYKVYYSWAVIRQYRDDENSQWDSFTMFDMGWDECSLLGDIPYAVKGLKLGEETSFCPMGDGADWVIKYNKGNKFCRPFYSFNVWDREDRGYRFRLSPKDTKRFIKYIEFVQAYMLAHSEPI